VPQPLAKETLVMQPPTRELHPRTFLIQAVLLFAAVLFGGVSSSSDAAEPEVKRLSVDELATKIDELLSRSWTEQSVQPAPPADDAEFLRRVSLDLSGRIPRVSEVRDFLADSSPGKRKRVVEQRLDDPDYVRHFTNVWRAMLLSQATAQDVRFLTPRLEAWLRRQVRDNVPYDKLVREILTMPLGDRFAATTADLTPLAFYQANELKAENLAAATSRLFLGVNLDCAQCHNHPFADWTRDQFWEFASFFAGVKTLRPDNTLTAAPELFDRHELQIPGTEHTVSARFLNGREPKWTAGHSPRVTLADWLVGADNPYFARAIANRVWAHFFGRGLVDPLDDLGGRSPPKHPELLDELAQQLVAADFDLKFLMRAITASQAYGRSSRLTHTSQQDPFRFARATARGMTPEQIFVSLALATGCHDQLRDEFLIKFAYLDRPAETQTTILQALTLMNGKLTADATSLSQSKTLAAVAESPFLDDKGRIETLFLATLSRLPDADETAQMSKHLNSADNSGEALADIFWALLNSGEFILNH
jgi:hypothetical protein